MPAAIPAVATVAAAGISAGLGGGNKTTTANQQQQNQYSSRTPFQAQASNDLFGELGATNAYEQQQNTGPYTGSYYAGINPTQTGAVQQAAGYASGTGASLAGTDASIGNLLTGSAAPAYLSNASALAGGGTVAGPNSSLSNTLTGYATGSGSGLSGALNTAAMSGAQSIGSYNSALGSIISQGTADPTAQLAGDAAQYMNSSAVQSAVNSTNAQIGQTLNEQTLPGINRAAAMGGDLNSSRAGAANAEAQEGAALAEGNADASILNSAFNTGLTTAATQRTAGLATADNAASTGLAANGSLALGAGNQQVSAANSGLGENLGYETLGANTQLAGNSQLGTALTTGLLAGNDATSQQGSLYNLGSTAGGLLQSDAQGQLTNDYDAWQMASQYPSQSVSQYLTESQIPQGYYSGTNLSSGDTSQSTTTTAGPGATYGGLVGTIGGTLSNYFNKNGTGAATGSTNPYAGTGVVGVPSGTGGPAVPY